MSQTDTAPSQNTQSIETVPCLINGNWSPSTSSRFGEVYNPSSGRLIAKVPFCSAGEVDQVVQAAQAALPK
jgi:malonate-semialdehyde dehydrogenase (acetylating)/methylmalonate-semialdehyde dehydrogenase